MIGLAVALTFSTVSAAQAPAVSDADALEAQVAELYGASRFAEAEELAREILAIRRETLGSDHPGVAMSLFWVGRLAKAQGDLKAARPMYEESLEIYRDAFGPTHDAVATSLNNLAVLLKALGDYDAARPLYEESLEIRREVLGPRHESVGMGLNNLARLLQAQGDYVGAKPLFEESLDIQREALGLRHPRVATSLNNLALLLQAQGDFNAARPLFDESLDIRREALGSRHSLVGQSLHNLALLLQAQGDYAAALPLSREGLEIKRETLGPRHPDVARSLNNLAGLLDEMGDYSAARRLFDQSIEIRREALGRHPTLATTLNNLAGLLMDQGDYAGARPLYEESLEIRRETLGPRHAEVGASLSNLAGLLKSQGDYLAARALHEEGLEVKREALGPRHPSYAISLGSLAVLLKVQGDYPAALSLLEESLDIQREAFGPTHPNVAWTLNSLASLQVARGEFSAASVLFLESLDIRRQVLGPRHPDVALGLNNLGAALVADGDHAAARPLLDESLEIWREVHGPRHPDVALGLRNLAELLEAQGDLEGARPVRDEALDIVESRLDLLNGMSEREALRFLPLVRPSLDNWLALFKRPEDADSAWTHVLLVKGALAARARAARVVARIEPEVAEIASKLDAVRSQRARLTFADTTAEGRIVREGQLAALAKQQEALERQLLSKSASYRQTNAAAVATPATLCEALPPDTALIDLLKYSNAREDRYLAFVLLSDDCRVHRIELGPAAPLERATTDWQAVLRDPEVLARRVEERGVALAALLLEPLAAVAGDRKNWMVVPDGPLATLPFGALPTDTGFVMEDRHIRYLDRANDVIRSSRASSEGALLVGGVDYDSQRTGNLKERTFLTPCNGGGFTALPGTAAESERVGARWRKYRRKEPLATLSGAAATESAIANKMRGKAVVHIATHGFFATGKCKSSLDDGVGYDPMLLSGLVLAGANQPPDPFAAEDGILTASEVAACDLSNTGLVVLSACETGLGELASGQGVLGLRRAFSIAGAQSLIMSLWSVSDDETVALMDDFYRRHLRRGGMPAGEALREAQLAILAEQRNAGDVHPYSWAAFIASGR